MEGEPRSCSALEPCCQNILGPHYPLFLTSGKIMWESWCTSQPCSWLNRGSPGSCQWKITGWVWWARDAAAPAGQGGMEPLGELGWLQGWGHSWIDTSAPEMAKHSMWGKRMKWAGATHPCGLERQIQVLRTPGHCVPGMLIRLLSLFSIELFFHCGWRSIKPNRAIFLFKKAVLTKTCLQH